MNEVDVIDPWLTRVSREFALICAPDGSLQWADTRAQRIVGGAMGRRLHEVVTPGAEARLDDLIGKGARSEQNDWEIPLVLDGRPVTVSFCACPHPKGVALLGHLIPEVFSKALSQVTHSMNEVMNLNRQVISQKREIERRHHEAVRLHDELTESHHGVLTMHAELEDRAQELNHTSEIKSRVVSNVSHEFRTPLHSIMGLSKLLLEQSDGPLNEEQVKQVGFIRTSAEELIQLVNDLLDLSKAEAGKASLRMERFDTGDFLSSMRGVLRPLLPADSPVQLVVEPPTQPVSLETDKAKLSQILRNLVSNALKFTEQGEVRISTELQDEGRCIRFQVRDTGIGIEEQHLERIFEEFGQVENPLQSRTKGTGLGLPLSRRLSMLLGGKLTVESEPGKGSVFTLVIPVEHAEVRELNQMVERSRRQPAGAASILVVEDDRKTLFIYEKYLFMAGFHVLPARTVEDAREILEAQRPAAIVLDIMLEGETSWKFLADLKQNPNTQDIPVLVVTVTNREQKARALGADEFWLKPIDQDRLLKRLRGIAKPGPNPRVLVIDDDEKSRYIIRKHLVGSPYQLAEAESGPEGVRLAQEQVPHVILLDFLLNDMTAFDVLDELKADPRTRPIPVIVVTSHALDVIQKRKLLEEAEAVISKQSLSRELAINRIRDALRKAGVTAGIEP